MLTNELTNTLNIQYPIIQAPMAGGITTSELVTAVSLHGGLGMIGAGYLSPCKLKEQIKEIKQETTHFGVNLFVFDSFSTTEKEVQQADQILQPLRESLQVPVEQIDLPTNETSQENFHKQIDVILEENVPICSFTFGLPEKKIVEKLKSKGIILIGTATTVEEAIEVEKLGMDIVVVQGSEAGGHRGNFLKDTESSAIGLMSLIPQVVDHVNIPVIAAGGIMDGRGLMAALCLGAKAVQMGTAFMLTEESGAHHVHQEAILHAAEDDTILTRVFSGKYARGIKNEFIEKLHQYEESFPAFPVQNTMTQAIRKAAGSQDNPEYMSLWSGQSPRLAQKQTVASLIDKVVIDAENLLSRKSAN